ncbi:type II secretion system protein [Thermosulfurimonas marina]|uniref:type II secretion system protein n=1 Tax=Thermosulfurimonas marina TaxID=2047767 RepID=UPI00144AC73D|nr:type II secretion system protein [Thermosulfurimonas marina]
MKANQGFTLIELAITLVIIGILLGMGAGLVGLLIKRSRYNENLERLRSNVEALIGYALTHNGRLPSSANCSQALKYIKDVWGKDFVCVIAPELSSTGTCARQKTSLQVIDYNEGNQTKSDLAFVIFSGGPNYNLQTASNSPIRIYTPDTASVDDNPSDLNRPESYDDMVQYVSLNELKAKLKCPYREEYLRILNNELPSGYENSTYNARVYAAGGVPFTGEAYEWCVEDRDGLVGIGLGLDCNGTNPVAPDGNCSDGNDLWPRCAYLQFSGNATGSGTYRLTFFVRDADGSVVQKSLALTINP